MVLSMLLHQGSAYLDGCSSKNIPVTQRGGYAVRFMLCGIMLSGFSLEMAKEENDKKFIKGI